MKKDQAKLAKQRQNRKKLKRHLDQLDLPEKSKLQVVAVRYDVDKDKAPKIVATGKGPIADMILQVAEEHKVPFYEDQSLVDLLSKLNLDEHVPAELYTLVAEVLAFVYQLDKLAKKRQKVKRRVLERKSESVSDKKRK